MARRDRDQYVDLMATKAPFIPPRPIVRAAWKIHRALFRFSGGRLGLSRPKPEKEGLAQLTTIGHRSGLERSVMFAYFDDGDDIVTMAMNGWSPGDPAWWKNLKANPEATVVTVDGPCKVIGRAAAPGEEHDRLWERWREIDKWVDRNAELRPEGTPVVILSPSVAP